MFTSRPITLLCAAILGLTCTACASQPCASSTSVQPEQSIPELSVPEISAPDASNFSVSEPETTPPPPHSVPTFAPSADEGKAPTPSAQKPASSPEQTPEQPQAQVQESAQERAPEPEPEPVAESLPPIPLATYDYSQPIPERESVETDYFADAAFVGDSRSEGFYLYGVKRGKNLSASGLSVFNLNQKKSFPLNGTRHTALDVLSAGEYTKIYLGFGVNELGYINADAFYEAYCETIDAVRACQPTAVVYVQTMAPVNEARVAATGGKKHLNNDRVRLYNDLIRTAAAEKCVPLLDVYTLFAVDGSLPAEASRDGVHLSGDYCRKQLEYLQTHTVSFEELYTYPITEPEVTPDETTGLPTVDPVPAPDDDSLLPQPEQAPLLPGSDQSASAV